LELIALAYPNHFQFVNLDKSFELKDFAEPVEKIRLVKTYYLYEGRNAWHSTWVTTYIPQKSLYSSLAEAKQYAEKMRKRGSVFNINLIPSFLIKSKNCNVLVTQINSRKPFSQYTLLKNNKSSLNNLLIYKRLKAFLRRGIPLNIAVKTFDPDGVHWLANQLFYNNIIIEYGFQNDVVWDDFGGDECKSFQSYAQGSQYYLGWSKFKEWVDASTSAKLTLKKANKLPRKRYLDQITLDDA
jgi:hypothetical protein